MQCVSTLCDMAEFKPTDHFRSYPLQDVRSVYELTAMIRLRTSGIICGTCSTNVQSLTHPHKKEYHRIRSGDLDGQRSNV